MSVTRQYYASFYVIHPTTHLNGVLISIERKSIPTAPFGKGQLPSQAMCFLKNAKQEEKCTHHMCQRRILNPKLQHVYAAVLATLHFDVRDLFKLPKFVPQYMWHEVCALSYLYYPKMINDTYWWWYQDIAVDRKRHQSSFKSD